MALLIGLDDLMRLLLMVINEYVPIRPNKVAWSLLREDCEASTEISLKWILWNIPSIYKVFFLCIHCIGLSRFLQSFAGLEDPGKSGVKK